jgi:hypothetical protein
MSYSVEKTISSHIEISKSIDRLGTVVFSSKKDSKITVLDSYKTDIVIHQKKQNQLNLDALEKANNIDAVLKIAKTFFSEKQSLYHRLENLIGFYDEEDSEISIESLKSMLVFFSAKSKFSSPSMTLNEDGTFQINWRKDNLNLITLRFRSENFVDFLIFKSSQYTEKPIVSNGNTTVFDFIEEIKKLNLTYLVESKLNG